MLKEELVTYQIHYISRIIKRHIDQATVKYGLTAEQGRIILYLHQHNNDVVHLTDLESSFNLRKSTLTSTVNILEKNGYVIRTVENNDLRQKRIVLTPLGEEKVQLLLNTFKLENDNAIKKLTNEESKELSRLLNKVLDSINE